jgi:hypothetical protein
MTGAWKTPTTAAPAPTKTHPVDAHWHIPGSDQPPCNITFLEYSEDMC